MTVYGKKGVRPTLDPVMLFSHVKISSFRMKAHLALFHWCLYNNEVHLM